MHSYEAILLMKAADSSWPLQRLLKPTAKPRKQHWIKRNKFNDNDYQSEKDETSLNNSYTEGSVKSETAH